MPLKEVYGIGGLNRVKDARNLKDNEYNFLLNCRLKQTGNPQFPVIAVKKPGQRYESSSHNLYNLPTVNSRVIIALSGIRFWIKDGQRYTVIHTKEWNGSTAYVGAYRYFNETADTWDLIHADIKTNFPNISISRPARFAVHKDHLFMVDGTSKLMKWSGVGGYLAYVGIKKPTVPTVAVDTTVTSPMHDILRYAVTFVNHQGESQLGDKSVPITTLYNAVKLTNIPTAAAQYDVISRRIYRERASQSGRFFLIDEIPDNTTTSWYDQWGKDKESAEVETNEEPPEGASLILATEDTIVLSGIPSYPYRCFPCKAGKFESWSSLDSDDITEPMTAMSYWQGNYYLYSRNTVSAWKPGNSPSKIVDKNGCLYDTTLALDDNAQYWLSANGYVSFNGNLPEIISQPYIQDQLNTAMTYQPSLVKAVIHGNLLRVSIEPTNGQFKDHHVYNYDLRLRMWCGPDINMPVGWWISYNNSYDNNELFYLSWHSNKYIQADTGSSDINSSYAVGGILTSIVSKIFEEGSSFVTKTHRDYFTLFRGRRITLQSYARNEGDTLIGYTADSPVTVTIGANEESAETFATIAGGETFTAPQYSEGYLRKMTFPISVNAGYGTNIQFFISTTENTEKWQYCGLGFNYFSRALKAVTV